VKGTHIPYAGRAARVAVLVAALLVVSAMPTLARPDPSGDSTTATGHRSTGRGEHTSKSGVTVGRSYRNDVSPALRTIPQPHESHHADKEASPNPRIGRHINGVDPVVQDTPFAPAMPNPVLNFNGIPYPGVSCNCAPPDTNGEVGLTQYVQIVNEGIQVFDKTTGASVLGPISITTLWAGFGGVCEVSGAGDPVVLYDQLANRWVVTQFAGVSVPTDECIAVSTSSDATGTWNRYGFHLGTNFFDYPKLAVWPDAYYMAMNVFNTLGTAFLGPQPFAFDRAAMLAGTPATFVTTGITGGATEETYLPADLDGSSLPPAGAPNTFVEWPSGSPSIYKIFHFHVDFATPANSSFTLFSSVPAAPFTQLCASTRSCVPQLGTTAGLDGIADRFMFRAAYRNFGDHESLVTNYTVSSGGVAGVRWIELRNVTSGPVTVNQESTYQPDSTWRWMGSAAMDKIGDLAVGFSASSASINPQIRYAGRLAGDPLNTLAQGEATLFAGTGSQTGTSNRWGDYSDLTVDPVDDCTFWYTNEYYASTGSFNWRTRIGNFKFPSCGAAQAVVTITKTADAATINAGSQLGFTVTLSNQGSGQATGLSVTDALPAGTGVSWTIDAANTDPGWSVSGSPPNQSLAYSLTTLAGNASTHVHVISATGNGSCGVYNNTASFIADNSGPGSASASVTVTGCGGGGPVSQITGTGATCSQFAAGTATTLGQLSYSVRNGKVSQVTPGSFLYWVRVTAVGGSNQFEINQSITTGNFTKLFSLANGSRVYTSSCGSVSKPSFTASASNGTVTVQWNAASSGTYFIALRLNASSVRGEPVPQPTTVHYQYSTTGVSGSTSGIDLAAG
jgi:uncharacterized repeat protein (TIGR01451 family)